MSTADATHQIKRMMLWNSQGWGDQAEALRRVARRHGLPFGTLDNLRTGRTKTILADMRDRVRDAYLAECERQLARLSAEIATERAKGTIDDDLRDLDRQVEAMADRLARRRAQMGRRS